MEIKNIGYSYYDCENNCDLEFGGKDCENCDYYRDCMVEKEIADFEKAQSEKLNRQLSRLENGDFI